MPDSPSIDTLWIISIVIVHHYLVYDLLVYHQFGLKHEVIAVLKNVAIPIGLLYTDGPM